MTWTDSANESQTGVVEKVNQKDGKTVLTVSGTDRCRPDQRSRRSREQGVMSTMMRGMFAAISGLKNHQVMLDVTANDIANVNTIGYKSARTTFKDSLTQLQRGASGATGANGGTNAAQVGLGVGLGSIDNLMTGGALQTTGNPLDVAIQGEGFFRVAQTVAAGRPGRRPRCSTPAPATSRRTRRATCSRRRASTWSARPGAGGADQLHPDPGRRHERRHRPRTARSPTSRPRGGARVTAGYLSLATFQNAGRPRARVRQPLARLGELGRGAGRRAPARAARGLTTAGTIEMSNVDLAQTFTSMITAQRGFQANSRVISTSDEMLQDLVNLKR